MKVRSDFVTNSSSSSFILVFKDAKDFQNFETYCKELEYQPFLRLVKRLLKSSANNKAAALELLETYYKVDVIDEHSLVEEYAKARGKNTWEVWEEAREDPYIKAEVARRLADTAYEEKKRQIEESEFVVRGQIWDSNGGLLEWAIRNDFIKSNFRNNHICTLHVG